VIPRHDLDLERAILATVMLEGAVDQVVDLLPTPEAFFSPGHRYIWAACLATLGTGKKLDLPEIWGRLDEGQRREFGGIAALSTLLFDAPAVGDVRQHVRRLLDLAAVRRVGALAARISAEASQDQGEIRPWLDRVEGEVYAVTHSQTTESRTLNPADAFKLAMADMASRSGYATGFTSLDQRLGGLRPGELIIVAARPGMGKTAFVGCIAANLASTPQEAEGGQRVDVGAALVSCEMSAEALGLRMVCTEARVSAMDIRKNRLTTASLQAIADAATWYGSLPVWIHDASAPSVLEVKALARRLKAECERKGRRLGVVAVDYLQLMRGEGKHEGRTQEVSQIARGLKQLAKECGVAVVALSQLSREVEKRANKRPIMADLRESGEIEAAADAVLGLYRDEYYNPRSEDRGVCEVLILKNRNGEGGAVRLAFNAPCTRFEELQNDEKNDASHVSGWN
jgi:replicative DNA helicase